MLLTNDEHFELTFKIPARGGSRGGRVEGGGNSPFGTFSSLSDYLCLSRFHIKNNII